MNSYTPGVIIEFIVVLADTDSDPVTPDTATATVLAPDGTSIALGAPTTLATGTLRFLFDTTGRAAGRYRFRFTSTGTGQSAVEDEVYIRSTAFTG